MTQPETIPDDPTATLPPMLTTRELAAFLRVDEGLLAKWRSQGVGPAYVKMTPGRGGAVRYHRADVRTFLTANRRAGKAVV